MSLPLIFIQPAPTTDAGKAAKTRGLLVSGINSNLSNLADEVDYLFNLVWKNPMGLTAQQVLDAFGTEAAKLFQYMGAVQDAMNVIQPGICPQKPPQTFTINKDGTVTVT